MAEKDEFEYQLKELEVVCAPIITIITKLNQAADGRSGAGGMPGGGYTDLSGGPTIEEVD